MWEVDPETKGKLALLQKRPPNTTCADCSAPSPQWASPKFGTFICLSCAGLHRGLGVHISFVRSISMDAFKPAEIARLDLGGNKRWQDFWVGRNGGQAWGRPGEGAGGDAVAELERRYGGEIGEEWKERLGCEVEGREFTGVPVVERKKMAEVRGVDGGVGRTASPLSSSGGGTGIGSRSQKEMNENYFAKKGNENANRPDGLAPSQGGKYAGFGSSPMPEPGTGGGAGGGGSMPGADEFQKDPVAALTKGFGWFAGAVGKQAKSVNEGWIQPTAAKIAEADLAKQAQQTAAMAAKGIQSGTKVAAERFNNFVEDTGAGAGGASSSRSVEPERKDFWDSFGDAGDEKKGAGAIGTAAMRKGGGGGGGGGKEDKWDNW